MDDDSYRVFRFPWSAQPSGPPDVVARKKSGGGADVYVSWNGATEVAKWRVVMGSTPPGKTVSKTGFETHITLTGTVPAVQVQALDKNGMPLGSPSKIVTPS